VKDIIVYVIWVAKSYVEKLKDFSGNSFNVEWSVCLDAFTEIHS